MNDFIIFVKKLVINVCTILTAYGITLYDASEYDILDSPRCCYCGKHRFVSDVDGYNYCILDLLKTGNHEAIFIHLVAVAIIVLLVYNILKVILFEKKNMKNAVIAVIIMLVMLVYGSTNLLK